MTANQSTGEVAVFWIRDGVLINRMPLNAVAFAVCYLLLADRKRIDAQGVKLEGLINFAFQKSGVSCAEKMRLFNAEVCNALADVDQAAHFYNEIASEAGKNCSYFAGTENLLSDLHNAGVKNFITSAVEQAVLDQWATSTQAASLAASLTEILGKRPNFSKGKDHFQYVANKLGNPRIFFVADAVSEIQSGHLYANQYKITPIGFANLIDQTQVAEAAKIVQVAVSSHSVLSSRGISCDIILAPDLLDLPSQQEVENSLLHAGSRHIATGSPFTIMDNLRRHFQNSHLLT